MKQLSAILFIAGAFVVGGSAIAGQEERIWICHIPATGMGDAIEVSTSAWRTSPHSKHGDCPMDAAKIVYDEAADEIGCSCEPAEDPAPEDPAPTPAPDPGDTTPLPS